MCGRFTQMYTWQELIALYRLGDPPASNLEPHYNISPTDPIGVITAKDGKRSYRQIRWASCPTGGRRASRRRRRSARHSP